ncbi:MAG: response regulator [Deltaproteobacteria bacterium]|nr:response regulator [Deltaproteobacteria bacterium]MBW1738080.1 response regulator [Deltaproteobacteria bacterium]MBW1908686.1 response regulator [Deltaproteobacteria bacterium]MBW2032483.1 response regulator [Deltaproteobacteria bacterium]MBW2113346.1 response regulator [Deltaproteobacteria bacterium]
MIKNVLVVDDDQELLLSLTEGLERYGETFSVLLAGDGQVAVEKLKENTISLVVTDLKMPNMDGFALLAHIMEQYPEIPVIIITAYSTPKMEKLAREGGAVGYIEKPFMIDGLARKIMMTLRKETEGGTLHGVSSGIFLQLIEMEQKTCTIRLVDKSSGKQGVLFFRSGELLDAKSDGLQGESAAYEIFSWDETTISIQNSCGLDKKKITRDLQAILLEAMRLKDEAAHRQEPVIEEREKNGAEEVPEIAELERAVSINTIRDKLKDEIGGNFGLEDIYEDSSWDGLVAQMSRIGVFFDAGKIKISYIDRGESNDFILLPGKRTTVLSVNPRCPKDRIIQVLSD